MIINLLMSVAAIHIIFKQNRKKFIQGGEKHLKKLVFKSIISITWLIVLFGLGWMFGLLTIREASPVFKYLFVLFSAFHGVYFFLFICILQKEARDFWTRILTCGHYGWKKVPSSSQNKVYGNSSALKSGQKYNSGLSNTPKTEKKTTG